MSTSQPVERLSASCQIVSQASTTATESKFIVRSNLADPDIFPVISGHRCNGVALVPSSLWADMALVISRHLWNTVKRVSEPLPGLNVSDMECPKGMIAQIPQPEEGQWVEMEAQVPSQATDLAVGDVVHCIFWSIRPDGTKLQQHATCKVRYEDKLAWKNEWDKLDLATNVKQSIKLLQDAAYFGGAQEMEAEPAYHLFERFVAYSNTYRGMDYVCFDILEGTSTISFKTDPGKYTATYHLDNSCHLSGFLCNALDDDKEESVYISEGWHSMRYVDLGLLWDPHRPRGKLMNYVRMIPKDRGILEGDLFLFEDAELAAVWEGLKFKRIPKRLIDMLLKAPKQ